MTKKHWITLVGIFFLLNSVALIIFKREKKPINWQFFIENQIAPKSILNIGKNLSFDQKDIYFGDGKNSIYSLDQNTGKVNWVSKIGADTPFQIKVDEKFLYIASFDSHIHCLDKKNGFMVWSYTIDNQFLPDTEVVFDDNDQYLFFADRGGSLHALDKKNGQQVWKINLGSIDNTKAFREGSIHFGFLKQNDQEIIADHFPNSKIYKINKNNGLVVEEKESTKTIELSKEQSSFNINKFNIAPSKQNAKSDIL